MSETVEKTLLDIYNHIVPQISIPRLSAEISFYTRLDGSVGVSGIDISADDETLYVCLTLRAATNVDDEDINNYRWEYMDCFTGAVYESDLDYQTPGTEVIAFFQHTLATDKFTNWRG
jgi:hypothetical protein